MTPRDGLQERKYRIRLDEGTRLSSALPDPDIDILGIAPTHLGERIDTLFLVH